MTSDFCLDENGFLVEDGVLVKFNAEEFEGDLNDLYVPEGVTEIGENAFVQNSGSDCEGVEGLTKVTLPTTCTVLRRTAFYSCQNLIEVDCLAKLEIVEIGVFSDCNNLEYCVGVPKSQDFIPDHLYDRGGIIHVRFPNHVKRIGFSAFYDDVNLESVDFNNVEVIESSAFFHCSLGGGLRLTKTVSEVGSEAFRWARPPYIKIENPDIYIESDAFDGVDTVETLYVPEEFEVPEDLWGMSDPDSVEIKRI